MIIAQISDPHITVDSDAAAGRLRDAVSHIGRLPTPPDVVLITGDCTQNGAPAEYGRFRDLISPLAMPAYVIPGNHDNREQLALSFGAQGGAPLDGFVQYVVDAGPLRLVALDTHVPGRDEGLLCERRLAWLAERLAEEPERPTLIFMHHPPFSVGLAPTDRIGLTNAAEFGALIRRHPQVEALLAGHVHMTVTRRFAGTVAVACPATGHALLPDFSHPERLDVVMEPPACLLHVWGDGTGLVTIVSLIGDHGPLRRLHDGERWLPQA